MKRRLAASRREVRVIASGRHPEAVATIGAPVPPALGAEAAKARIVRCWALIEAGRCHEARALLSGLEPDVPDLAVTHASLARRLQAAQDLEGAEREMRHAVRLDRRDPALHAGLGEILAQRGALPEAEDAFRAALALSRTFIPAATALARLLLDAGRPGEALVSALPLTLRQGAAAAALQVQAEALLAMGKPDDALAVAERALRAPGAAAGQACLQGIRGHALADLGRTTEAEEAYRRALACAPHDRDLHLALADLVWRRGGDIAETTAALDLVLAREPSVPLLTAKAALMIRAGAGEAAQAMLARLLQRAPEPTLTASAC